jgi:NADH-quinone oxidoreductase subunit C
MTLTPEEVGARLAARLDGDVDHTQSGGGSWARATVDVPVAGWRAAVRTARDDADLAMNFFDWLSAVDEVDTGFTLVAHLWSTVHRHGVLLRTRIPDRAAPVAPSIVDIFPGAAWHERETHEMFGIEFTGHGPAGTKPLLLPPEFEGHPLRKDFVLATRVAKPWPGAKEPGESGAGPAKRQPMRPPGVPDPREWGPAAQDPAVAAAQDSATAGESATAVDPATPRRRPVKRQPAPRRTGTAETTVGETTAGETTAGEDAAGRGKPAPDAGTDAEGSA